MTWVRAASKAMFTTADLFLRSPNGPRILIYHQVGSALGRQMEVTVEDFVKQLDWLGANRQLVSLDTALENWSEPDSDQLVALTFDDGYRDTYETAFPVLNERQIPFTLYLATEPIEHPTGREEAPPLTWDQIEEMMGTGLVTVGGHTHTHADLRLIGANAIEEELETCDALIEHRLGVKVEHFAYPWGYWSDVADPLIRRRYSSATVGSPTPGDLGELDRFLIHRYPIQRSDGYRWFKPRLRGGLLIEEIVRRQIRGYDGP